MVFEKSKIIYSVAAHKWRTSISVKIFGNVGPLISFSFFICHSAVVDSIAKVFCMIFEYCHFFKQIEHNVLFTLNRTKHSSKTVL